MKTEIIALANWAEFSKSGSASVSGIFDEIYVNQFPSSFIRSFVFFTVIADKPLTQYKVTLSLNSPDKKTILSQEVILNTGRNKKSNYMFEMVGMPLPQEGKYSIKLHYKGEEIGDTTFDVMKVDAKKDKSPSHTIN